jgi:hypothetical protein
MSLRDDIRRFRERHKPANKSGGARKKGRLRPRRREVAHAEHARAVPREAQCRQEEVQGLEEGEPVMKWICKGRTYVSPDGRYRIAHVFRTWILYGQGVEIGEFLTAEAAMDFAEGWIEARA